MPTSFPQAVTATQTQTPSTVRSAAKHLSATETQTGSIRRAVGKLFTKTQTQTVSLLPGDSHAQAFSKTQTQMPTLVAAPGPHSDVIAGAPDTQATIYEPDVVLVAPNEIHVPLLKVD